VLGIGGDPMTAMLLAPHADDETLFAFYTLLREQAVVYVVLDSGPEREGELDAAMAVADRPYVCMRHSEAHTEWSHIREDIQSCSQDFDSVIAPAYEKGGHEHHNEVALIAATLGKPLTSYLTYVRGRARTTMGLWVIPAASEKELKRRAMDCYASQIADPNTAPWFDSGWEYEYVEAR
jgi:LmbE family N-acetylglucosaminyl deacetylase